MTLLAECSGTLTRSTTKNGGTQALGISALASSKVAAFAHYNTLAVNELWGTPACR